MLQTSMKSGSRIAVVAMPGGDSNLERNDRTDGSLASSSNTMLIYLELITLKSIFGKPDVQRSRSCGFPEASHLIRYL